MAKKDETPEVEAEEVVEVVDVTDQVDHSIDHGLLNVQKDVSYSDYTPEEVVATVVLSADEARTYLD